MIILFSNIVLSADVFAATRYLTWGLDGNSLDSSPNGRDALAINGAYSDTFILGNGSYNCEGSMNCSVYNSSKDFDATGDFTVCMWVNFTKTGGVGFSYLPGGHIQNGINDDTDMVNSYIQTDNDWIVYYQGGGGGTGVTLGAGKGGVNAGQWNHLCYTFKDSTPLFVSYINGVEMDNSSNANLNYALSATSCIGTPSQICDQSINYADIGFIDGIAVYSQYFDTDDISIEYNGGLGYNPFGGGGGGCTNFTITATDVVGNSLVGFYANVTYNGTTTTLSDTAGTITTGFCKEDQLLADITWFNESWFDDTGIDHNTSANYIADYLYQAVVNIRGTEIITNNTIVPDVVNVNGIPDGLAFRLLAGNQNISLEKADYYNLSGNITIEAMDSGTFYYLEGMYQTILTIGATNASSGTGLLEFNTTITGVNETYTNNAAFTSGVGTFYLLFGDYNVTIDAYDRASNNSYLELYATTYLLNATLYTTNSINFTFYDEETGNVIDDRNITIELIGGTLAYNSTTESGSVIFELLLPQEYIIRYSAPEYSDRYYYFTLIDDTINWLDLYMANASNTVTVTATVYDEGSFALEGAQIRVLRFNLESNSYAIHEMCETSWDGTCLLHLIPENEWYKYYIYYDGELRLETTPQILPAGVTTLAFQISTTDDPTENYYLSMDVTYSLGFLETSDQFRYYFSDKNAVAVQGCLYVYRENAILGSTLINSSCTSGATATIFVGVDNVTDTTYRAKATIFFGDNEQFIDSQLYTYRDYNRFGSFGLLLIVILMVVFAMMGIWNPLVASIITPMPLIFGNAIGLINLNWGYIIPIQAVGILIAFIISRRG